MRKYLTEFITFIVISIILIGIAIKYPPVRDRITACYYMLTETKENVANVDSTLTFNGGIILDDNSIDYTACSLTFEIDKNSFIFSDDHIAFQFNPIDIKCKDELKNNPLIWTIAAYDVTTNKLVPTFYLDNGTTFDCYIYTNGVPYENIELVFSGSLYDENTHVLDDYLLDQSTTPNSIIKIVKLVS